MTSTAHLLSEARVPAGSAGRLPEPIPPRRRRVAVAAAADVDARVAIFPAAHHIGRDAESGKVGSGDGVDMGWRDSIGFRAASVGFVRRFSAGKGPTRPGRSGWE